MRPGHTRPRKALFFKLLGPTLLLLLPLLLLGGSLAEAGLSPQSAGQATGDQALPSRLVVRVYFRNTAERDSLATELDALEVPTTGGYLTVISDQTGVDSLRSRGLRVEIDADQTARMNATVKFGNTPDNFFGGYHTVEEMQQFLDAEVAAHPNLAEKVDYGDSWCKAHPGQCTLPEPNNGYDLLALHITNRSIPGPKPVFWLEANIHAREIAPPEIAVDYISYLLDNYDSDADAHWLVDWHDIYVVPTLNPDGHHIVEAGGGGQNPYYQRKNANDTNGCATWPPAIGDQFGTDLNRNFPFLWNCCGGSSDLPCSEAYHGAAAQSEDETQAVVNEVSSLIPDQRGPNITDAAPITTTGAFLDLHSFADVNLYPWGMYETQAPNDTDLKNLAFHMSSTSAYPAGNDYTPCQFGPCLYIADGASNDWAYGELGAAAFAVEIGEDFFEPYTYTQSILWPQNRGMMLYMAKASRMPYLLTRGPDATLVSSNPMTVTQGITSELSATISYAWEYHGAYSNYMQNVAAAEYYLDTPPWAGGTAVAMQAVDGAFDEPVEGVQASVQTGSIPVGRHILFVRGRGVNSYEGYQSWGPISASWLDVQPYASPTPTATGTPPTATPTSTTAPTSTPTSTPCSAPAMQNGGFETGSFTPGWSILDTEPTPIVSTAHTHSGSYAAFLGSIPNNEPSGDSSIYQTLTVPASGGTLSFWYYPYSRDNIQFDWQDAYITDVNGNILATVMHVLEGTETWTNVTYDLTAYAGQTIRVEFLVHQDGAGDVAHMYVDDVLLIEPCTATPMPTVTPTMIATATPSCIPPAPPFPAQAIIRAVGVFFQANGKVYNIGGRTTDSAGSETTNPYEYDPGTNAWTTKTYTYPDNQVDNMACGVLTVSGTPYIYCVGGSAAGQTTAVARVLRYNPATDTGNVVAGDDWPGDTANDTLPGGFAVWNNKLYIIGGFQINTQMTNQVWEYDPNATGSHWTRKVDMPSQLGFVPATTIGNYIYTAGGSAYQNGTIVDTANSYRLDPAGNTWTTIASIPRATGETRALTIGGTMWVLGGGRVAPNPSREIDIYDPASNSWSIGPSMGVARRNFPADTNGTCIWLWGGYVDGAPSNSMEIYCGPGYCPTATVGPSATLTPTPCPIQFTDVPVGSTFYPFIECLACRGIINGYPCGGPGEPCNGNNDPYFRPSNNVSRGQFAKIAANSAGFNEPPGAQQYEDVAVGSTFFDFIWRLSDRGYVTGYPCGGVGEPCGPNNLPYFRPNANVTRGQLSKIDANAAGFNDTPGAQQYEDVLPGSTFYDFIWRLSDRGIINGYPCGGTGEPCGPNNLPYFRPGANATRGQASKIVSNTFFPSCQTPVSR